MAAFLLLPLWILASCHGDGSATPAEMRARIEALTRERDGLRAEMGRLVAQDPRLRRIPQGDVQVGVPAAFARTLIQRVVGGFVDQVSLRLSNIDVHKAGTVRKMIPLGDYDLAIRIGEVTARLETGKPDVRFAGNEVAVALPVRVASGAGSATVDFSWKGRSLGGAVCGDMEIHQKVVGNVRPADYLVRGALRLSTGGQRIVATPRFPRTTVNLKVDPSPESWAAVQKVLAEKEGLCGFVLDKVDIRGVLADLLGKGFNVTLPTENLRPMTLPVGLAQTMSVGGHPVTIGVQVRALAIAEPMIWVGADVDLLRDGRF